MSVKVCDRGLSKLEAVYHATELRQTIHNLCIRNLGIKDMGLIVRRRIHYKIDPEANLDKYMFILYDSKKRIIGLADSIMNMTRVANRIKMDSLDNCNRRLHYQELAIDYCEMLIAKLQDIASLFLVDINRYKESILSIEKEITLVKGWIKYTNKVKSKYLN